LNDNVNAFFLITEFSVNVNTTGLFISMVKAKKV